MKNKFFIGVAIAAIWSFASMGLAKAETISTSSYLFQSLDGIALNGTGLGNYNVILFAGAAGGSGNDGGSVNVDNSNTSLPSGGTSTSGSLYWMTSIADLQAYYNQQFGAGNVNNIVLFLDINETGAAGETVTINALNIYKNATTTPTNLNPTGTNDLTSAQQNSITGYTGGTLLTQLANLSPQTLGQKTTGQGVDDWSIFTFIDPFDPAWLPSDTLLFNVMLSGLSAGAELVSISGELTACDISPQGCGTTSGSSTSGESSGSSSGTSTTSGTTTSDPTTGTSTTTGTASTGTSTTTVSSTSGSSGATSTQIPEPASFLLFGAGLVALSRVARKKRD